jgi:hypothetical protein
MGISIGFILLTHNKPHQVLRLVHTLNQMFDQPLIVGHHDFSQSLLPIEDLPNNMKLVHPHYQTGWGRFSVIEGTLAALQMMYENSAAPDWVVLLSGADYPIQPAATILADLEASPYDVHMHHEEIRYNRYERKFQALCYQRYCHVKFHLPLPNKKFQIKQRQVTLRHPWLTASFLPFSRDFRCFAGEHWFYANRKAAEYLLEFHRTKPRLASHYRRLDHDFISPDESYYQTVFCNAPHFKISQNHWRYIDWSTDEDHPQTLGINDLIKLQASSAHFARKFDMETNTSVLDELDQIVLQQPSPHHTITKPAFNSYLGT